MTNFQWHCGTQCWSQQISISATDRALSYGDGVFETFRIHKAGHIPFEKYHIDRLLMGLKQLHFNEHQIAEVLVAWRLLPITSGSHLVGKLIVSRGVGPRGYDIPSDSELTLIWQASPAPAWQRWLLPDDKSGGEKRKGIHLEIAQLRLGYQPALAGIKHLNRLEQVLARQQRGSADDVLLLDQQNTVIETALANIIVRRDGKWITPDLSGCGIRGVVREWLIDRDNVVVDRLLLEELDHADAVVICNSVLGIVPVERIGHRQFNIADEAGQWQCQLASVFN